MIKMIYLDVISDIYSVFITPTIFCNVVYCQIPDSIVFIVDINSMYY